MMGDPSVSSSSANGGGGGGGGGIGSNGQSNSSVVGKTFENIYLGGQNGPQTLGKLKLAGLGIGFQEAATRKVLTMASKDIKRASWQRCARDYELRVEMANGLVHKFDGFPKESFDLLADLIERHYRVPLEAREISLRGYNWGKAEFKGTTMNFNVQDKTAFEIPLTDVANTATAGRNEVSIELVTPQAQAAADGSGRRPRIREDALCEIHFYVPGMAMQSQVDESAAGKKIMRDQDAAPITRKREGEEEGEIHDEDEEPVLGEDGEALTAAAIFCETIKSRVDVGVAHEESIISFDEVLCLAPRGRYEMEMFESFFRIRGKSHDYRVLFTSIKGLYLVPKPDDVHHMFVVQLDPPVRQGQTRYPFLVFQFDRDKEEDFTIKMSEEVLKAKYGGKIYKVYDGPTYVIVSDVFSALTNRTTITGGVFRSAQGHSGIKCALKANEAFLYPLEKCFLSFPKPTTVIPHSDITLVTFQRVSAGSSSATKTFEIRIATTSGVYTFSSIPREEYTALEEHCRAKKLKVTTELGDGPAYQVSDVEEEEDDENPGKRKRPAEGQYGGEDDSEESEDEDFVGGESDSDVDLEFDSDAASSDGGSGSESDSDASAKRKSSKKDKIEAPKMAEKSEKQKPKAETKPKTKSKADDSKPAKKAKKEEKDPNAPKRPSTAYIFFSNEVRTEMKAADPTIAQTDIMKKAGAMWKELPESEKQVCNHVLESYRSILTTQYRNTTR
ncbi:hypothetical protein DFJ73DRAFT_875721 [Zopfochytrium polystomum]|nr:hypothetical protein DFJ73DRAFT_875721 [Zopfochytrium polystomum]